MKIRNIAITTLLIGGTSMTLFAAYISTISRNDFKIETRSPEGTYHVTFEGKADSRNSGATQFSSEKVRLTVLKARQQYFVKDPFFGERALDLHFKAAYPHIEWVNDFTLRMGGDLSLQPFRDEIKVSNETSEILGVVEVFYGRYERFLIFDFAPGTSLSVSASPQFNVNLPPASTVTYKATNLATRKERTGLIESRKRNTASEGPISTFVEIIDR